MESDLAAYDDLVHHIYDAALEPAHWTDVVGRIAHACGGSRSLLFTPLHGPAQGGFAFPNNIPQANLEKWASSIVSDDPIALAASASGLLVEGNTFSGRELVSDEHLKLSRLYRELWVPLDIAHVCSGIVFGGTDARTLPAAVSVYRRSCDSPFAAKDLNLLRRLMAHMSRSLGVMFHLRDSQLQVASSLAALDRFSAGVVLLDDAGGVQFANAAAQRAFRRADPVTMASHAAGAPHLRLAARLRSFEADLKRRLAAALAPLQEPEGDHFSEAIVLPDAQGKPLCVLHVAPLGRANTLAAGGAQPRAIVFLYDLAAAASVPTTQLCDLFGLTPAEVRAALQVLQGGSGDDMAARLDVSVNTFKSQLKAAYAKSNTHRQADLLKLLLALAAV